MTLFGKCYRELGFQLVTNIQPGFRDAGAVDDRGDEIRIEFKLYASQFKSPSEVYDYIVCWMNDLSEEGMRRFPKIIAFEEFILERFL